MAKRKEKGAGTISYSDSKKLWHGKYTVGIDGGTGKPIRKSVYGKTQGEVATKIRKATAEIDSKTYKEPSKMSLRDWLDTYINDYTGHLKIKTLQGYKNDIDYRIKPQLGAMPLMSITHQDIQDF
ncbi:MAG: hypothetical protein LBB56_06240, partial [Chitinispirillales bacterium]|nr:hypothetical protein [Chitinispirillales bacterium]